MIIIICCILILVGIVGIILSTYTLIRNEKVYKFRQYILSLCVTYFYKHLEDENIIETWDALYKKWSYEEMLKSFKPLKLKNWYTEEEINTWK